MRSCGHDGWQAGCAECEHEEALATAWLAAAEQGGERPLQTRWRLRRTATLTGLNLEVVVDTTAWLVVEAIETAAARHGIELERIPPEGKTIDELIETGETVPRRFGLRLFGDGE